MKLRTLATAFAIFSAAVTLSAQVSLFNTARSNRADRKDMPTIITADAMDIDIANNKASFMGNVIVDDPEMTITCRKMTIYLSDDEKAKNSKAPKGDIEEMAGGKRVSKIECVEDVVIARKQAAIEAEEQKALAGRAVYDFKKETITLSESPVVIKGKSRIRGERIKLYTQTERIEIFRGTIQSTDVSIKNAAPAKRNTNSSKN